MILQVERNKTFWNIHMDAGEKLSFVSWQKKVQALKASVFYIVAFNDEHTKPAFERKLRSYILRRHMHSIVFKVLVLKRLVFL